MRRALLLGVPSTSVWLGTSGRQPSLHALRFMACAASAMLLFGTLGCASLPGGVAIAHATPSPLNDAALEAVHQADALYAQAQYGKAQAAFKGLVQAHPGNAYFWFRLGNCETQLGRYPEAISAFEHARGIDPWDGRFIYNLAIAHSAMARDAFDQARAKLPVGSPLRREAEQNRRLMEAAVGAAGSGAR